MKIAKTYIRPDELHALLVAHTDGVGTLPAEVAVIDIREQLPFARGHLLHASPVPLDTLDLKIGTLVPRFETLVVLVDNSTEERAGKALPLLEKLGYVDVRVLEGGVDAWGQAGFEIYEGLNAFSKGFAEWIEAEYDTPRITVDDLQKRLADGEDLVVLDTRTSQEFHAAAIPGSTNLPGVELPYRGLDAITSPQQTVVVTCGGRTRAIIGAQVLINLGIENPVVELLHGTNGWQFAGYATAFGATQAASRPVHEGLDLTKQRTQTLIEKLGIETLAPGALAAILENPQKDKTTYVFDVRSVEDYREGHIAGSKSLPGGQLLQEFDLNVAVQGARIVLLDAADGVRAGITASWLKQSGWRDVVIAAGAFEGRTLVSGDETSPAPAKVETVDTVSPQTLSEWLQSARAVVVDLRSSRIYSLGHIPGAWFSTRTGLADVLPQLPKTGTIVLADATGSELAFAAASDLAASGRRDIAVLEGGIEAWRKAGLSLETVLNRYLSAPEDIYASPTDLEERKKHYADYVQWGHDVVGQLRRDKTVHFIRIEDAETARRASHG